MAEKYGMPFFEVSAKDNLNVRTALEAILVHAIKDRGYHSIYLVVNYIGLVECLDGKVRTDGPMQSLALR